MRMVIAFVQPFMVEKVVQALHGVSGITGATFTGVRGFGRGRAKPVNEGVEENVVGTVSKVRVEAMVPDELEETVVRAIQQSAHTGRRGDGKIYVAPIERAVRIATGDEGESAV